MTGGKKNKGVNQGILTERDIVVLLIKVGCFIEIIK
jgi:hypothetical protein